MHIVRPLISVARIASHETPFLGDPACQRRCDFVVCRRTGNVEKWRVNVYSLSITKNVLAKTKTECVDKLKKEGRLIRTELYGEGVSDRTVWSCHARIRTALDRAVQDGLIRTNPAADCKLPPQNTKEMQILTREEVQRFLIQAKEKGYYELFLLELATGLRRGEMLALQWDDLNFDTGELRVER